jgi:polyisoprenoid-binding protein YceI
MTDTPSAASTPTADDSTTGSPRRRRVALWVGLAFVVVIVLAGAGAWWFFGQDAPARVDIDTAAAGVTDTPGGAPAADGRDLAGTWNVSTSEGSFDYGSATGTFAGFRIREELASVGSTEAVGRTGEVSGVFVLDGNEVTSARIVVDLASMTTDRSQRDGKVREALDVSTYPEAVFELTSPIAIPAEAATGSTVSVTASGDLTIRGVTRPVTVPLQARLVGETVVIVGEVEVAFADYGITVPSAPVVLSVEDTATLELQLLLTR